MSDRGGPGLPASLPSNPATRRDFPPSAPPPPREQPYYDRNDDRARGGPGYGGGPSAGYGGGGYDRGYGGGGRGRSPSPDWDDRRKRRRSLSPPFARDGRRESYAGDRGGPPLGWNGPPSLPPPRREPPRNAPKPGPPRLDPPAVLPYLVTPSYFTQWIRVAQPSADPILAFRQYRAAYFKRGYQRFFDDFKEKPWFREKYAIDQDMADGREKRKERGREGLGDRFYNELVEGKWEELSFDYSDYKPVAPLAPSSEESKPDTDDKDVRMESVDDEESPAPADPAATTSATPLGLSRDLITLSTSAKQLVIKTLSPELSRAQLEEHFSQVPGFDYLAISDPNPAKNFQRVGWASFKDASDLTQATEVLCESTVANFTMHMVPNLAAVQTRLKVAPGTLSIPARIVSDLENIRKAVAVFETEQKDTRVSSWIEKKDSDKKKLDLYLQYLRTVFHTCYYCVVTCDYAEELERKCPTHLRRDIGLTQPSKRDQETVAKLDDKLPLLVERGTVDPGLFGGDSPEEEMHRLCHPVIKQEEEGKFRCKECNKLFSALKFIEKHIGVKHTEVVGDRLDKLKFFNNYVLDPSHMPYGALESVEPPPPPQASQPAPPPMNNGNGMTKPLALMERLGDGPARHEQPRFAPPGNGVGGGKRGRSEYDDDRRDRRGSMRGPPPPPPPGAVLDPRAGRGQSSYADLDGAPAGVGEDVILPY